MTISFFENVYYCNDDEEQEAEGLLQVSEDGLYFQPHASGTSPSQQTITIYWQDITARVFVRQVVGVKAAGPTLYKLKIIQTANTNSTATIRFQLRNFEEWERLQSDLEARGQTVTVQLKDDSEVQEVSSQITETESKVQDDFSEIDLKDEAEGETASEVSSPSNEQPITCKDDTESSELMVVATAFPVSDSAYYPVSCRHEIGTLLLTPNQVQFTPDHHRKGGAATKRFPYNTFSASPFFAPIGYPQATMRIYYYVTTHHGSSSSSNRQQSDFVMEDHNVLNQLESDIMCRVLSWKDAPRGKVDVPARPSSKYISLQNNMEEPSGSFSNRSSFFKYRGKSGSPNRPHGGGDPSKDLLGVPDYETTEDPSSSYSLGSSSSTNKTPLIIYAKPTKKNNKEEHHPQRIALVACLVCCMITFMGLCFSVVFGYFFAERRPPPTFVRTQMDSRNIDYYLVPSTPQAQQQQQQQQQQTTTMIPEQSSSPVVTKASDNNDAMVSAHTSGGSGEAAAAPAPIDEAENPEVNSAPTSHAPDPNTPRPTQQLGELRPPIREVLMSVSPDGGTAIRTSNTPQQGAYLLLAASGAMDYWSDDLIVQKYALTVLYYSTQGKNWKDGADSWKDLAQNDCFKELVLCDQVTDRIVEISMPTNNLQGSLPPELALLTDLERLNLATNGLTGMLPTELGLLKELQVLDLSDNPNLKGVIPKELLELNNLESIKVDLPPAP